MSVEHPHKVEGTYGRTSGYGRRDRAGTKKKRGGVPPLNWWHSLTRPHLPSIPYQAVCSQNKRPNDTDDSFLRDLDEACSHLFGCCG